LPLENKSQTNCFFNATAQILRLLPEARFFFYQAYHHPPAAVANHLAWARDLGKLFDKEGPAKKSPESVVSMRNAAYFPQGFSHGQQDAMELLEHILELKNDNAVNAQTLAKRLFSFNFDVEMLCLTCNQVCRPPVGLPLLCCLLTTPYRLIDSLTLYPSSFSRWRTETMISPYCWKMISRLQAVPHEAPIDNAPTVPV
jgi:hypothetical protein